VEINRALEGLPESGDPFVRSSTEPLEARDNLGLPRAEERESHAGQEFAEFSL